MNEQVITFLSKKWVIPTAVGVASFGAGGVLGYIWGKRNGDVFEISQDVVDFDPVDAEPTLFDFEQDVRNEVLFANAVKAVEQAKHNYMSLDGDDIPWELDEEAELMIEEDELLEAIAEQTHLNEITNDGDTTPLVKNIFANAGDHWNYEHELSTRTEDQPYVIHLDEWVAEEAGCEQSTVTFYAGDSIMADQFDTPIYNYAELMGDLKFGHGSDDPSVVYIRNERLELEWEVILHSGRFEIEVLGHDIESAYESRDLKHSAPRFRDE